MSALQRTYSLLADLVLVIHAGFVGFVVVGLVLIWVGRWRQWAFVRGLWFRAAHLFAIGVVAAESIAGCVCPLTTWENRLRIAAGGDRTYAGSFVEHWLHRFLFFDASERVFMISYVAFFAVVALTLWLVPPRRPRREGP